MGRRTRPESRAADFSAQISRATGMNSLGSVGQ